MNGETERREALKKRYGFAEWGLKPAPDAPFVWDFFLPAAALPGWRVMKSLPPDATGGRRVRRYMLEVAGDGAAEGAARATAAGTPRATATEAPQGHGGEALDLRTFECPSWADAREAVLDYIATCAGPRFRPGAELKYDFGEVAWGGAGGPGGTALFVRGNMFLVVRRALGQPRVEGLARWLDQLLGRRPGEGDRGGKAPPEMKRLEAGRPAAERRVPLTLEAHDPLDRPVWYQVFARGGEVRAVEGQLFVSPVAGEVQVEAFAFNENCHWARGAVTVKG